MVTIASRSATSSRFASPRRCPTAYAECSRRCRRMPNVSRDESPRARAGSAVQHADHHPQGRGGQALPAHLGGDLRGQRDRAGAREDQQGLTGGRVRIGLFTNNYLPFCGGVTVSVETLRRGLEARGHEAWVLAPRFPGPIADPPRVLRYPSIPATTYPEFPLAIPFARAIAARVRALAVDVFHAHHPF